MKEYRARSDNRRPRIILAGQDKTLISFALTKQTNLENHLDLIDVCVEGGCCTRVNRHECRARTRDISIRSPPRH
jgi:hypothetical protein